ncbi:MAG: D-glycerate dehydrogenase [Parcubacteria group bacterium]|nr:D-glycerate dehydrogenase [Parcubacteria group bacterium]
MKVFVSKTFPAEHGALLSQRGYDVEFGSDFAKARGADAILTFLTDRIDKRIMESIGPQLKIIGNCAVGTDNIDLAAAREKGILITNTPNVLTEAVAEHAVAMTLGIARHVAQADAFMRQGKYRGWEMDLFMGTELRGKMLGIIGHGRIGCRTAEIFQKGFDMNIVYTDTVRNEAQEEKCHITFMSLLDLLKTADVVSIHVPLLPTTRHLVGQNEFQIMKETSFLVNTSRGPIVDEKALVEALKAGKIKGAALDVFEEEPRLAPGLTKLGNVLLTPHIASATKEARGNMAAMTVNNIIAALSGQTPPNLVHV